MNSSGIEQYILIYKYHFNCDKALCTLSALDKKFEIQINFSNKSE